jgi:hypothetical protein
MAIWDTWPNIFVPNKNVWFSSGDGAYYDETDFMQQKRHNHPFIQTARNSNTGYSKYMRSKADHLEMEGVVFFRDRFAVNEEYEAQKKSDKLQNKNLAMGRKKYSDTGIISHRPSQNMINYAVMARKQKLQANDLHRNNSEAGWKKNTFFSKTQLDFNNIKARGGSRKFSNRNF